MQLTWRVEEKGLRELGEKMRKLSDEVNRRIAGQATGAAANIVKKAVKGKVYTNPSYQTGALYRSVIAKKLRKGQTRLTSEHIVTFKGKAGKKTKSTARDRAPHAHFLEFGTVNMPAEPILRPGFEGSKAQAKAAIIERLRSGIDRASQ